MGPWPTPAAVLPPTRRPRPRCPPFANRLPRSHPGAAPWPHNFPAPKPKPRDGTPTPPTLISPLHIPRDLSFLTNLTGWVRSPSMTNSPDGSDYTPYKACYAMLTPSRGAMTLNLPLKRLPLARDHHQPLPPRPDPWRSPRSDTIRSPERQTPGLGTPASLVNIIRTEIFRFFKDEVR